MTHSLEQKIVALRRRAWRMAIVYGVSLILATLLGAAVALGLVDYLFRFQDRGLRIIFSLAAIGAFGWAFYRFLFRGMSARMGDVDLALRVQRRFPSLGDGLVSAVEFLHAKPDDPAAGSVSLRRAVIAQSTADAERIDFGAVLDPRPAARAVAVLAAAAILVGLFVVIAPMASRVAMARLVNPFGNATWPRTTNLALREPVERVARGGDFQIGVVDARGAPLPADVRVHYRFTGADGVAVEETDRMQEQDGARIARRENVLRPFSYRVEGGDDASMPWRDVEVVEPPAVESLSVRLIPPAYTGWPPMGSPRHIRALSGTAAQIAGKATKPLRSIVLCVNGGTRVVGNVAPDGRAFAVEFPIERSGAYWLELTDRDGLVGGRDDRWEVHAVRDAPPKVSIEQPAADLFVTSGAVIPLRVAAEDDLALVRVAIAYEQSDPSGDKEEAKTGQFQLWKSSDGPRANPLPKEEGTGVVDRRTIDGRWRLAPLSLKPGTRVTFFATADDAQPQTGRSEPRNLTVITPEELQDRVADREKLIVAELERALRIERACRAQAESLTDRLAQSPRIGQAEVDRIQSVGHAQRDVDQILTSPGEGLPTHIRALLADLENNGLQNGDLSRRMSALSAEIDRLRREHLPAIGRELTAAAKMAQVELEDDTRRESRAPEVAASLTAAAKHQDAVIAALVDLIGQQARWDDYRRFAREIGRMVREQADVTRRTAEVGRRTLTQELRELASSDAAALKASAGRQLELARQLDRLLQEMEQAGETLRQRAPSAAKTVAQAVDEARRSGVSGEMRSVGRQIERNQIGRAAAGQKQVGRDLKAVLDALASRQEEEADGRSQPDAAQTSDSTQKPKPGEGDGQGQGQKETGANVPGVPSERPQKPSIEEVHAMMRQLWGELPERARQQMLQSSVEQFTPKYQTLIEDYYRRLAEEQGEKTE